MTATADEQVAHKTLYEKLHDVAKVIDGIAKNGHNDHQHYDYVQASDVTRAIREEFLKQGIGMIPSVIPGSVNHQPAIGGKGMVTTVEIEYTFYAMNHLELGGSYIGSPSSPITVKWIGAGSDIGGDKGLYKAYTGALKYMLLTLFLIPTGDDPERDETSVKVSADDARPAAPEIPQDRAKAILAQAQACKLANVERSDGGAPSVTLSPVLKAKLADVGVTTGRIGNLNVDQAEDVEAFLTAEAANVA